MIELRNFSIGFGPRIILDDISTRFREGRLTALIGRNGSGKSTLLRALAGLNPAYSGGILIDGDNLKNMSPGSIAKKLAFVATGRCRIQNMKCEDVVAIGRAPYTNWIGRMQQCDREIVEESLRAVGMSEFAKRPMDSLSDGECQRIMIARALAQDTESILLDEPTSFLDLPNRYELVSLLNKLAHENGKCVVFSTHELEIAMKMCDDIALVDNGNLINIPAHQMKDEGHVDRLFHIPLSDFNY